MIKKKWLRHSKTSPTQAVLEYLVKWKNCKKTGVSFKDSWEPASNLARCVRALEDFAQQEKLQAAQKEKAKAAQAEDQAYNLEYERLQKEHEDSGTAFKHAHLWEKALINVNMKLYAGKRSRRRNDHASAKPH